MLPQLSVCTCDSGSLALQHGASRVKALQLQHQCDPELETEDTQDIDLSTTATSSKYLFCICTKKCQLNTMCPLGCDLQVGHGSSCETEDCICYVGGASRGCWVDLGHLLMRVSSSVVSLPTALSKADPSVLKSASLRSKAADSASCCSATSSWSSSTCSCCSCVAASSACPPHRPQFRKVSEAPCSYELLTS